MRLEYKNSIFQTVRSFSLGLSCALSLVSCVDPGVLGEQKIVSSASKEGFKGTPAIEKITPISGKPGSAVFVTGNNLRRGLKVDVGGQQADLIVKSTTEAEFSVPEGSPGEFQLKLISGDTKTETETRVYRLAEGYPVFTGDGSMICQGYKFFNAKGELSDGTRNCLYDDQVIDPHDIVANKVISGVKGTFPYCSAEGEKSCIVDNDYAAADMSIITPGVIKKDVTIAGITGAYPSSNFPLAGSNGTTLDLTGDTFIRRMTSNSVFEYFDSSGNRYTNQGDEDLVATNLRTGVELEPLNVTGRIPFTARYVSGNPGYIQLDWHDSGAAGYMVLAKEDGPPTMKPTSGTPYSHTASTSDEIIYTGSENSFKYENPTANKLHHFALYVHDDQKNFSPYPLTAESDTVFCSNISDPDDDWIAIPGNAEYNTSDFCVMQFEASRESDVATQPISRTQRTPWTDLTQGEAIAACQAIGGELISNDQWMTIATKIINLADNWSELSVGQGTVNIGHSDNEPAAPCPVPNDQTLEYLMDSNICTSIAKDTPNGEDDQESQKRTHTISDGVVIWDFGGNVMEWTSDSLASRAYRPGSSSTSWFEYTGVTEGFTTLEKTDLIPSIAINQSWNSGEGIGKYFRGSQTDPANDNGVHIVRGGTFNFYSASGIFSAFLDFETTDVNSSTGFRCVWVPSP